MESIYQHNNGLINPHNLQKLAIKSMLALEVATVPCIMVNIRWIYLVIT